MRRDARSGRERRPINPTRCPSRGGPWTGICAGPARGPFDRPIGTCAFPNGQACPFDLREIGFPEPFPRPPSSLCRLSLDIFLAWGYVNQASVSQCGLPGNDRFLVWVDPPGIGFKRLAGDVRERPDRMTRGRFCMSPLGTDVMGIDVRPVGAVCRCVSAADTSLSLSLSLFPI